MIAVAPEGGVRGGGARGGGGALFGPVIVFANAPSAPARNLTSVISSPNVVSMKSDARRFHREWTQFEMEADYTGRGRRDGANKHSIVASLSDASRKRRKGKMSAISWRNQ